MTPPRNKEFPCPPTSAPPCRAASRSAAKSRSIAWASAPCGSRERGIWGPPADRAEALRVLKRLPELDIDLIDTADAYGPEVSENLIREALYPYKGLVIATKGGLTRPGPERWTSNGAPEYLAAAARKSRERLGVKTIALWQLHRIDPAVPAKAQFEAVKSLMDDGVIAHAGLSEVSVKEIEAARKVFPVATVQNRYNLADRESEDVLDYCEKNAIGFIPWFPLSAGALTGSGGVLDKIAAAHKVSQGAIALAWLLKRSAVMLPIPGTSKTHHLEENMAAAGVKLSDEEFTLLDRAGRK
jgi:aryl-alcohol dehydrogenase-like predicted oxidoreductase